MKLDGIEFESIDSVIIFLKEMGVEFRYGIDYSKPVSLSLPQLGPRHFDITEVTAFLANMPKEVWDSAGTSKSEQWVEFYKLF